MWHAAQSIQLLRVWASKAWDSVHVSAARVSAAFFACKVRPDDGVSLKGALTCLHNKTCAVQRETCWWGLVSVVKIPTPWCSQMMLCIVHCIFKDADNLRVRVQHITFGWLGLLCASEISLVSLFKKCFFSLLQLCRSRWRSLPLATWISRSKSTMICRWVGSRSRLSAFLQTDIPEWYCVLGGEQWMLCLPLSLPHSNHKKLDCVAEIGRTWSSLT